MAETFNIELEADLSEFTSTVTDSGDLSQSAAAALAGTSGGLLCLIDDQASIYGQKDFVQLAGASYRLRFYIDPNGLAMANGDDFQVCRLTDGVSSRLQVWLRYDGASHEMRSRIFDDNGTWTATSNYNITDEPHYIEVLVTYATGGAANDGIMALWIDDLLQQQIATLDLFSTGQPDEAKLGAVSNLDAGTSGTFYLDEFVLRDDDTEIGAVGGASPPPAPGPGAPYFTAPYGVQAGSRAFSAINVGYQTTNYVRGGQYWPQGLEYPKGSGTILTYKQLCAQLAANDVNLLRIRLDGDNDPYGNGKFAFEPPPHGTYNAHHNVLDPGTLATYRSDQGTGTWSGNWSGSNLERLINACGSYDIKLWVAPFHWFEWTSHWTWHAWNSGNKYLNGVTCEVQDRGFVADGTAIFTNGSAIAAAKTRLQVLIDSVGSSDVVAAWEICAELPFMCSSTIWGETWGATQRANIRTKIVPWVKAMSAYITANDPHGRPQAITALRIPPGDWSADPDNYWNVVNEVCVATAAIKFVGVNAYTNGDYDEAVRHFRAAQEYVGTADDRVVIIDQYEGSDNSHPPNAIEASPYRPSKATQWIGVCGAKWGLGSMRWIGFNEIAPNNWADGNTADPNLAAVAGVSSTFSQYVDWNAHRQSWQQRHGDISSVGLDSVVASGNAQYVTLFAKWTSDGAKTLSVSGMTNGAYTFRVFNWLTGASISVQDVTVTTGTASIPLTVGQSESCLVGYLATQITTVTGAVTVGRDLRIVTDATTSAAPVPDTSVTASDASTRYELRVRGSNGSEVARMGAGDPSPDGHHVGPFQYVKHVNSPGGLIVRLSGGHPLLDQLEENGQVEIWRNAGADWYRDFTAIWTDDYDYEYRGEPAYVGYAPGKMTILDWSTVAWAAGSANRSKFTAVEAETATKTLVQYNVTSDAGTANGRDLDWTGPFTVTLEADRAQGAEIDVSCPRQPLLEILQEIALSGGGDFDLIRNASNPLEYQFRWYHGQRGLDRTATVRFAVEMANMRNVTYRHRGSQAQTAAIVGGRGEGEAREIEPRFGNGDGANRHREVFVNATEVELGETDALRVKGDRHLADNADTEVFSFEVAQTPSSKYGIHYCQDGVMGDLVTVVRPNDGQTQTHKIVEVTVAVDSSGRDSITVGTEQQ